MQPNGKRISTGTTRNYIYARDAIQRFSEEKGFEIRIRSIDHLSQRALLVEKNYWSKFYRKFMEYLYKDCGYFDNYAGQIIKHLRTFFEYLNKNLLLDTGDFYKQFYVIREEIPVITLLPEELSFLIYDKEFENALSPILKRVKDVFVFGCTVALRFSDLVSLKKNNIRMIGKKWYLSVRSIKTSADTLICLPDYAIEILKKYGNRNKGFLLPHFNLTNMNQYVKILCEKAGMVQPISKTRNKRGVVKEIEKFKAGKRTGFRLCDHITTHTMRRTAITTLLCLGMPEHLVRKISGHSPMSREFFRYVSIAQAYQDKETASVFDKLKEKNGNHV